MFIRNFFNQESKDELAQEKNDLKDCKKTERMETFSDGQEEKKKVPDDVENEGTQERGETTSDENLSRRSRLVTDLVSAFNHNEHVQAHFIEPNRSVSDFDKNFHYPDHLFAKKIVLDNFRMELLTWVGEDKWENMDRRWVILQFHGGGYVNAFKNHYRTMAGLYSEVGKGASVLSVDYRVAPEHLFPAALEDAIASYEWLLHNEFDASRIILAGDSAGGGLALSLCHYLKDHNMLLPAGIVCMSPWTDVTCSGASYKDKFEEDVVFGNIEDSLVFDNPYAGDADKTNPYISPLFGDFTDFPPILIQVGTKEMLLDDSRSLAEKAKAANVKVRITEYEGMFHVFQAGGTLMEESKHAWAEIGRFLDVLRER